MILGKIIEFIHKYPKFIFLTLSFLAAYGIFAFNHLTELRYFILSLGYLGTLIIGMLYAYGFTAGISTGMLLSLSTVQNIFIAGLLAGIGALFSDLVIFKIIKHSFNSEVETLSKEEIMIWLSSRIPGAVKKLFLPVLGCILIASPLPDEIGIALFAISTIPTRIFLPVSFILNTTGIFIILFFGSA